MNRQTPYFFISEEKLHSNLSSFQKAFSKLWSNSKVAYSVKTNSLPWLLQYLNQNNTLAEVVSDEEYQLAKKCGFNDDAIIFNGPIKGEVQFQAALAGHAVINLDSKNDLMYLKKHGNQNSSNIGIRVNLNPELFNTQDIDYQLDGFRFGFSDDTAEFENALKIVKSVVGNQRIGLHLHCNSITRSLNVYKTIANYAAALIQKYHLDISYVDIGGGFFGGVEGKPTPYDYIAIIKKELENVISIDNTTLIIEPGSAIIGSVADFYTSVIDVKNTGKSRIVTTDGSRINIDPLWMRSKYMFSIRQQEAKPLYEKQIVCGYTCMDHDRMMILQNEPELVVGDTIVYHRIGAYSMTFGGPFIRYFPDVYVEKNDGTILQIRNRMTVEDYYQIQYKENDQNEKGISTGGNR